MKVRVTIMTENDKPAAVLGENAEDKIKRAWELVLTMISSLGEDRATVEKVEVIDG